MKAGAGASPQGSRRGLFREGLAPWAWLLPLRAVWGRLWRQERPSSEQAGGEAQERVGREPGPPAWSAADRR